MQRKFLVAGLLGLTLSVAAWTGFDRANDDTTDPAGSTCLVGTTDCDDTGILDGSGDEAADPAGSTCLVGTADCDDTGILDGPSDAS